MNNCQQVLDHFASLVPDADAELQKRLVNIWSEDEQIRNFMLFDDIPGEDSPDIHENPQKKKSAEKKDKPKKSEKSQKSEKSTSFSPLKFLKDNPDVKIEFSGSKSGKNAEVFEKYKSATTFAEFVELARSVKPDENPNGHITSDYKAGLLKIHHPDVPTISPKSKKTPAKEKKVKKKKEETEENSEPTSDKSPVQSSVDKSPIPEQSPIPEENIEEKTIKKDKKKDKKKKDKKKKDKKKKVDEISSPSKSVEPVSSRPPPGKVKNAVQKMEGNKVEEKKVEDKKVKDEKDEAVSEEILESPKSSPPFQDEDDDDWPSKTVDGVTYDYNESDGLLIDKESGIQIGYLDPDGTIDFLGDGEEIHEKNQDKL